MIDESIWNNLLAMERSGRPGALQTILSLYLFDSRRLILEIRKAIQTGDVTGLTAGAHQLKSASAQVGALAAAHHSGEIERRARSSWMSQSTSSYPLSKASRWLVEFSKERSARKPPDCGLLLSTSSGRDVPLHQRNKQHRSAIIGLWLVCQQQRRTWKIRRLRCLLAVVGMVPSLNPSLRGGASPTHPDWGSQIHILNYWLDTTGRRLGKSG